MSLADYLAKNYLTKDGSKKKKEKKKSKKKDALIVADDDALGWDDQKDQESDDDFPVITRSAATADFRGKTSNWIRPDDHGLAEANAVLAGAAREQAARDADDNGDDAPMMESGARAGLQTAAQVEAALAKKRAADLAAMKAANAEAGPQETIYRDASGRVVNIAMARAEARRKAAEAEAAEAARIERNRGDVQRLEKEARKKELEDAKFQTLARYKDDVELNEELKEKEVWNDPAAAFLTSKKKGVSRTGKPLYQGPAPPNRFGIRPGHKWDGVDRGNGFEKKWFMARQKQASRQELEYAWEMDE